MIKYICSNILNLPYRNIRLNYNKYGKPFLAGNKKLYFSVSHSGEYIVFASHHTPIGIDIEKNIPQNDNIAKRFFSAEECEYMARNCNKNNSFITIWTQKEAYIKMLGKGLHIPLNSFNVLSNQLRKIISSVEYKDYIISACVSYAKSHYSLHLKELSQESIEAAFEFLISDSNTNETQRNFL